MDFIEIYDEALPSENCDKLIEYFNNSPQTPGMVGDFKISPNHKKSTELDNSWFSLHNVARDLIYNYLSTYTNKYVEKYYSIQPQCIGNWGVDDGFTLKKFEGEDDGFKKWHTEHSIPFPNRILVWMFYLNDAQSGTDFINFPRVDAKKGRLVIWPSSWTHTHRSAPNKGLKYIISGWYSFHQ